MSIIGNLKVAKPEPWTESALCQQVDNEIFYPEHGQIWKANEAKKVCALCEVRQQCLDYAIANHERFGVWGGMTVGERSRIGWSA